jgi:outer membrane murein-binding lipoprotein Lpp
MNTLISSILVACTLLAGVSASALNKAEFVKSYVAATNARIKELNQERKALGKGLYCAKLNKAQVALITKTAQKPEVTVLEFANTVSETLECYPPFWAPWKRKHLRGTLFNTKAYVLDYYLVRDALAAVNNGREPQDYENLVDQN